MPSTYQTSQTTTLATALYAELASEPVAIGQVLEALSAR